MTNQSHALPRSGFPPRLRRIPGMTTARIVAAGYLAYMLAGWALLSLPLAQATDIRAVDNLFTAVSAVSTTGLVSVDPGSSYTLWGQAAILLMIQVGGVGYMTISSFVYVALSDRLSRFRMSVTRATFGMPEGMDARRFVMRVVVFTVLVEAAGAGALYALFSAAGQEDALWSAVFHAVSAFCTAGFSLYATSFEAYRGDAPVLLLLSLLSYLGAVGFLVAGDVWDRIRAGTPLSLTTRIVLGVTAAMAAGGTALLFLVEPSLRALPAGERLVNAFFQAMSASTTVGFNSIPIGAASLASILLLYVVMLVGASPSGTGGGLKSTTVAILAALARSTTHGRRTVSLSGHAVPEIKVRKAAATLVYGLAVLIAGLFCLALTEDIAFERLLFEAISALATVGLSMGATGALSDAGKLAIVALMAIGRIGILGFGVALAARERRRAVTEGDDIVL